MSHVVAFLFGGACVAAVMWFLGGRDIAKCKRMFEDAAEAAAKKGPRT